MDLIKEPHYTFINSAQLKIIAMLSMFIDHIGAFILLPWLRSGNGFLNFEQWNMLYTVFRSVGRLAFPIFCFLIVEGFIHTSNVRRYMLRLAISAFVSEIPFDLARSGTIFDMSGQNVMFTLLSGLIAIWCIEHIKQPLLRVGCVLLTLVGVTVLNTDYSYMGVCVIIIIYACRHYRLVQSILGALMFINSTFAMPAFVLTYFYNGELGDLNSKIFYWFYPVHLLIYALIAHLLLT